MKKKLQKTKKKIIYNLVLFSILLSDIHHVRVWLSVVLLLSLQHEQLHTCGDDNFFSSLVTLKHNFFVWIVQAFFDPQWTDLMVRRFGTLFDELSARSSWILPRSHTRPRARKQLTVAQRARAATLL